MTSEPFVLVRICAVFDIPFSFVKSDHTMEQFLRYLSLGEKSRRRLDGHWFRVIGCVIYW